MARVHRLVVAALIALGLAASPAGAQVWKPKKKTTPAGETKAKAKAKPKAKPKAKAKAKPKAKPRRRTTRPKRTRSRPARSAKSKPRTAAPPRVDDRPAVTTDAELEFDDDPIIVIVDGDA